MAYSYFPPVFWATLPLSLYYDRKRRRMLAGCLSCAYRLLAVRVICV